MASSRFKRAHKTHALAQRAGETYPHAPSDESKQRDDADARLLAMFGDLCARVPDAATRANLLGVNTEVEAAWQRGAALPLLRAHCKALKRASASS